MTDNNMNREAPQSGARGTAAPTLGHHGPTERFVPVAVWVGVIDPKWRVFDKQTRKYASTLPRSFYARESARLCALNLNRGHLHVRDAREA